MALAHSMNVPASTGQLGCLHRSPALVSHPGSAAHFHRRPAKTSRIQAVIETETQSPPTSNGSAARVRPVCLRFQIWRHQCVYPCLDTQAGVPPGTPTVDTLVRTNAHWQSIFAAHLYRPSVRKSLFTYVRTCPQGQGETDAAPPYAMHSRRLICPLPTSSCQCLCMMASKTALFHPCLASTD